MSTASQLTRATNILASQGVVALSNQRVAASQATDTLLALIETLSTAIAADTPVASPVQDALDAVAAQVLVLSACVPCVDDLVPA